MLNPLFLAILVLLLELLCNNFNKDYTQFIEAHVSFVKLQNRDEVSNILSTIIVIEDPNTDMKWLSRFLLAATTFTQITAKTMFYLLTTVLMHG